MKNTQFLLSNCCNTIIVESTKICFQKTSLGIHQVLGEFKLQIPNYQVWLYILIRHLRKHESTDHGITHLNIWTFILWFAHLKLFKKHLKAVSYQRFLNRILVAVYRLGQYRYSLSFLLLSVITDYFCWVGWEWRFTKIFDEVLYKLCPKHLFATLCTSFNQMLFVVMETHCNESHVTHENLSQPTKFAVFKYFSMFLFSYSLNTISCIVQPTYGKGLVFFLFSKDDLHTTSSRKRPAKCVDVIRSILISFYTSGAAESSLKAASLSLLFPCWERIQLGLMWIGNREYPCLASELLKKATPTPWAQTHFFTFILG